MKASGTKQLPNNHKHSNDSHKPSDKSPSARARFSKAPYFNKCKLLKGDDESFNAEENENELNSLVLPNRKQTSFCVPLNHMKRQRRAKPAHFDQEMHKHGLLDKIAHIEQLKNHLEIEFGNSNKKMQGVSPSNECSSSARAYEFPFHKRTRSNSPIKNGSVFSPKALQEHCANSPVNLKRKPIAPQTNFVIGGGLVQVCAKEGRWQEEDLLVTGPTSEMKEQEDEWIYKRICFKQEGCGDVLGEDTVPFILMLNQV